MRWDRSKNLNRLIDHRLWKEILTEEFNTLLTLLREVTKGCKGCYDSSLTGIRSHWC